MKENFMRNTILNFARTTLVVIKLAVIKIGPPAGPGCDRSRPGGVLVGGPGAIRRLQAAVRHADFLSVRQSPHVRLRRRQGHRDKLREKRETGS